MSPDTLPHRERVPQSGMGPVSKADPALSPPSPTQCCMAPNTAACSPCTPTLPFLVSISTPKINPGPSTQGGSTAGGGGG